MRWLRWVTGLLVPALLLLAGPVTLSYAAGSVSYGSYAAGPGSSGFYAAEPSPHGSLAGSRAGVGRTPPGRELPSPAATEAVRPPAATEPPRTVAPPPTPTAERPRPEPQAVGEPGTGPALVNVLPLGAGLLLTGLGLGFLALRLRR
ncbi:hypothetical protein ACTWJ8_19780 [Streptomyces sp. SDT5-1]|uniref:hypothetical protein n=1 Tax=Streptomyces sp. SDT5-1 TaxID=3406418 RepID=UPI003FD2E11F